jgi:hypothetical protein
MTIHDGREAIKLEHHRNWVWHSMEGSTQAEKDAILEISADLNAMLATSQCRYQENP